jgi:hypothetical protein
MTLNIILFFILITQAAAVKYGYIECEGYGSIDWTFKQTSVDAESNLEQVVVNGLFNNPTQIDVTTIMNEYDQLKKKVTGRVEFLLTKIKNDQYTHLLIKSHGSNGRFNMGKVDMSTKDLFKTGQKVGLNIGMFSCNCLKPGEKEDEFLVLTPVDNSIYTPFIFFCMDAIVNPYKHNNDLGWITYQGSFDTTPIKSVYDGAGTKDLPTVSSEAFKKISGVGGKVKFITFNNGWSSGVDLN